jgi:hypothetical protein
MKSQKEQVEDLLRKFWRCIKESRPEPSVVAEAASWLLAETLAYVREDSRRVAAEGLTEMLMAQDCLSCRADRAAGRLCCGRQHVTLNTRR